MKEAIRPHYDEARRYWLTGVQAVRSTINQHPRLAHQGIQRSGTNYLCALLADSGYFVQNAADPRRNDPRHKHFRWQDDKTTIQMDSAFMNNLHARNIGEVNELARFPSALKHVVLFKNPASWLPSIHRWATSNGWIERDAILRPGSPESRAWLQEWEAYYDKWFDLAESDPASVLVVAYEDLSEDPLEQMRRVRAFMNDPRPLELPNAGVISKVAHSNRRRDSASEESTELSLFVAEAVSNRWQQHIK